MCKINHYYSLFVNLLLFSSIYTELVFEEITFNNEETRFDNLIENKYYHIIPESPSVLSNYIKLVVRDNNSTNESYLNYVNYAISYYQDDKTFSNRKQLSYGSLNMTIMWLKKEQIKNGFYLSIESTYKTCNYSFEIYPKNIAEILPGERCSYYVTEENKEMIFAIKSSIFSLDKNKIDFINFWAKGSEFDDLEISLKGNYSNYQNDLKKHSTYNAYLIKVSNIKDYEFEIVIKGKPGDLIKIGNLVCSGQNCKIDYFYNGVEYFGLLIKGFQYMNCFPEDILHNKNYHFKAYDDFHKEIKYIVYQSCSTNPSTGKLECKPDACIEIPSNFTEMFY